MCNKKNILNFSPIPPPDSPPTPPASEGVEGTSSPSTRSTPPQAFPPPPPSTAPPRRTCTRVGGIVILIHSILIRFIFILAGSVAQLVTCAGSCRTTFKWCEFDPRDAQQMFGTPFSKVSLR